MYCTKHRRRITGRQSGSDVPGIYSVLCCLRVLLPSMNMAVALSGTVRDSPGREAAWDRSNPVTPAVKAWRGRQSFAPSLADPSKVAFRARTDSFPC